MYRGGRSTDVRFVGVASACHRTRSLPSPAAAVGITLAGTSVLQQVDPLVWTMLAMSIGGAILTYLILALALWKFRDPETKGRRYG